MWYVWYIFIVTFLCHLGLIFVLTDAFSFFTEKQFQAHGTERGDMFRNQSSHLTPSRQMKTLRPTAVLNDRLGLKSRLLTMCPALTTVLTVLPAKVSQAIRHSF